MVIQDTIFNILPSSLTMGVNCAAGYCVNISSELTEMQLIVDYSVEVHSFILLQAMSDKCEFRINVPFFPSQSDFLKGPDNNFWVPGFPRSKPASDHIMWQVISGLFMDINGFLNVPAKSTGYPLCKHEVEGKMGYQTLILECIRNFVSILRGWSQ